MGAKILRLWDSEEAATMVEYALLVALIGAALISIVHAMGTSISGKYSSVSSSISAGSSS